MPVGRKLAYDGERGRLWLVCRRCGEWNLTPLEERWEALAECEAVFESAEERASVGSVGIARDRGLELVRIGDALPDDIANVRYGHRLRRRRRRKNAMRAGLAGVGAVFAGGLIAAGISVGSLAFVGYCAVFGAVFATRLSAMVGPSNRLRFLDGAGRRIDLPSLLVQTITLRRAETEKGRKTLSAIVYLARPSFRRAKRKRSGWIDETNRLQYNGKEIIPVLRSVLPWLNWWGGTEEELRQAAHVVDRAERKAGAREEKSAWEGVARGALDGDTTLGEMTLVTRLALEMAVTEELERRALASEALSHEDKSREAEEVAAIADNMFIPAAITDWIQRRKHGRQ